MRAALGGSFALSFPSLYIRGRTDREMGDGVGPYAWVTTPGWGRILVHVSRDLVQPDPEFSHYEYMVAFGQCISLVTFT